jgi:GT2 family glycosyltransferase
MNHRLPLWTAVIPTYGEKGVELTKECLESLRHSTERNEIIVVDDGSDGNVQEKLASLCQQYSAKLVACTDNRGFASACNEGIKVSNGVIVTLVNNDTRQINKTLDDLANFALFSGAATVGCKLLYEDYSVQHAGICYMPGKPNGYWDHVGRYSGRWEAPACRIKKSLCTGAMLAISRNTLNTVGLLDERYGMAVEDVDLQMRCLEAGMRIFYCGLIEAFHLEGKTRGKTPGEKRKHKKWLQAERDGMKLFFERWKGVEFSQFQLGGEV